MGLYGCRTGAAETAALWCCLHGRNFPLEPTGAPVIRDAGMIPATAWWCRTRSALANPPSPQGDLHFRHRLGPANTVALLESSAGFAEGRYRPRNSLGGMLGGAGSHVPTRTGVGHLFAGGADRAGGLPALCAADFKPEDDSGE